MMFWLVRCRVIYGLGGTVDDATRPDMLVDIPDALRRHILGGANRLCPS